MNKFDEYCEFYVASLGETDEIMDFIRTYWNPKHILANDKDFFLYEFQNGENVNFCLARNKISREIEAIMGFYPYSKNMLPGKGDFSGGILKVNPNSKIPMLGMELPRRMFQIFQQRVYIGNGANPVTALPLELKYLKHSGGKLKQFYMLLDRDRYTIAKIANFPVSHKYSEIQKELHKYADAEEMYYKFDDNNFQNRLPYKDRWYVEKRYFKHPIYKYQMWGIEDKTVLVGREIVYNGSKVLRIVDILGTVDELQYVGKALKQLQTENAYEYIDLYEHGIPDEVLCKAGFVERIENDENIIPNYFEPYECRNVDIYYHTDNEAVVIFKADGDQDRPNHR